MRVAPYEQADAARWDALVDESAMGTFLHSRRFLSYHGDRFEDRSLLAFDEKDRLVGVLPAAVDPNDKTRIVSHPGATYGGFVHDGRLLGEGMLSAFSAVCEHYRASAFERFLYKATPSIYHRAPSDDDLYALFRLKARRVRCDLSAAIALEHRGRLSDRRKRGARKAANKGIRIVRDREFLPRYWQVLEDTLNSRHDARPVHTLDEIELLAEWFPDNIAFFYALLDDHVVAGIVLFETATVAHAQYIAASPAGREVGAMDMLFEALIERAHADGKRYFDFGISNEDQGRALNDGLYRFKCEFGASGIVHEFYEVQLA